MPGCGNLKSHPDTLIDAIIFGRDLNGEAEDYLSEERFDKIRYYLKTGSYPNGSDRAEKSRLRSAGAHYKIITDGESGEEKLMLKDKEVISDPQKQYEIAHKTHSIAHAGINKTTASIADKYHWIRIKETVSQAIRNCAECRESNKPGGPSNARKVAAERQPSPRGSKSAQQQQQQQQSPPSSSAAARGMPASPYSQPATHQQAAAGSEQQRRHLSPSSPNPNAQHPQGHLNTHMDAHHHHPMPLADMAAYDSYNSMPVDPQIMEYQSHGFGVDQPHPAQQHQQAQDMSQYHDHQFFGHGTGSGTEDEGAEAQLRAEMEAQMGSREGGSQG